MQEIIEKNLGKEIIVVLRWGLSIRGILQSADAQMNVLIENAEEIIDDGTKSLGTILIRGDNIILVTSS